MSGFISFFHQYPANQQITYPAGHIRKEIRNAPSQYLSSDEKIVLLSYPVVYVHAWEVLNKGKKVTNIYIGETDNIARRFEEHFNTDKGESDWHSSWKDALNRGDAFSWFFGGTEMNKSMTLDLENSLYTILSNINNCSIDVRTQKTDKLYDYSNKDQRDDLLKKIWDVLKSSKQLNFLPTFPINISLTKPKLVQKPQGLQCEFIDSKKIKKRNSLSNNVKNNFLIQYPAVYIYLWEDEQGKWKTYVGKAKDLCNRHDQHLQSDDWCYNGWYKSNNAKLLMFSDSECNDSMVLDIENRLILYMTFLGLGINSRFNRNDDYSDHDFNYSNRKKAFNFFKAIIDKLIMWQKHPLFYISSTIFYSLPDVEKKCVSIVSPLYTLTKQQESVEKDILNEISNSLNNQGNGKTLLLVSGSAGTGKTVLISNLLFHLKEKYNGTTCFLSVNNEELAPAYKSAFKVWSMCRGNSIFAPVDTVSNYLSNCKNNNIQYDVLVVDEGHLLRTKTQNGGGKPQRDAIMSNSKVTVMVFDPLQFVSQYSQWGNFNNSAQLIGQFQQVFSNVNIKSYQLTTQLRMKCDPNTQAWIRNVCCIGTNLSKNKLLTNINIEEKDVNGKKVYKKTDTSGYQVAIFEDVQTMSAFIAGRRNKGDKDSVLLATYEYDYDKDNPNQTSILGKFHWHITGDGGKKKQNGDVVIIDSWVHNATVDEVGSIYDIQGFDLNYAAVIIGKSISYDKVRGVFVTKSKKHKAFGKYPDLVMNELYVLLTRGSKGLLIYAENKKLRNALIEALK